MKRLSEGCRTIRNNSRGPIGTGTRSHAVMKSGDILWCGKCGCFAETRANGLAGDCPGLPPAQLGSGGRKAQLTRLRNGLRPVTMGRLPTATWANGDPLQGEGKYSRLKVKIGQAVDPDFRVYVPMDWPSAEPDKDGKAAGEKARLMRGRIKLKEASEQRAARGARKKVRDDELQELIATLKCPDEPSPNKKRRIEEDDRESEAFWRGLVWGDTDRTTGIFKHVSKVPGAKDARTRRLEDSKAPNRTNSKSLARCTKLTCFVFGCDGKHGDDADKSGERVNQSRNDKSSWDQSLRNEFERKVTRRLN